MNGIENKNENETTEAAALAFAEKLETAVNNPEEAARRVSQKMRVPGLFRVLFDFIKSYNQKDPALSDEEWMRQQFAKPEYAGAWKGEAEINEAAAGIVRGVEDYENAKKSLRSHIVNGGGTRESWLAQQIEIGAEANGVRPEEYAKEIAAGLEEAAEENAELFYEGNEGKENKKEAE